jgi:Sec-independent protein translocase protein TatA
MKDQIRMMKANAVTEEDRQAIKELKEHMKAAKQALKEEWRAEKLQWKEYKKCDKKDRKEWKCDKKDRKDRKDKKCDKTDRLVAKHVADLTIPDNSELSADSPVTKTWRLRNAGLIAWPVDSHLIFISRRGDNLNGPERVFVGAVEPQQEVDVSVTFITPPEAGRYIGYYRMATGDGAKFGQRVWVSFIIPATAPRGEAAPNVPVLYPVVAHTASTTALLAHDVTMH